MASPAALRTALLAVAALLATVLVAPATAANAATAAAQAVERERVYGAINCPKTPKCPHMKVLWFDKSWSHLGTRRANGGGYALRLAPGTYHLQFVDQRPAWDTAKYAPTDITVTVRQHTVSRSVTMRRGAAITGVARGGGKALRNARVVAANRSEQSFATTANKKGQFAIGGLPAGKYCLFTYDRSKKYVDKCTWVGGVDFGQVKNRKVKLATKAGNLTVFVETRDGGPAPGSFATVTSRTTGQWWTARVRSGKAVFRGVHPGRYTMKYDGGGVWFAATGAVHGGAVRPQRMAFGDFTVPQRGGWLEGVVVDSANPDIRLADAVVVLSSSTGAELASTTSAADGSFRLDGPLATQSGLTVEVRPGPYTDYLGTEAQRCQYTSTKHGGLSVTTNRGSWIGAMSIDRKADGTCRAPLPGPAGRVTR